ncbi:MAG: glycosyltransferase family 1 protein [Candidatus Sulfotelmatobacter sp.]
MRVAINCLQVDPRYVGGVTSYVLGLLEGFAEVSNGCQFRVFISAANAHLFHDLHKPDLQKPDHQKPDLQKNDLQKNDLRKPGQQESAGLDFAEVDDNLLGVKGNLCRAALLAGSAGVYKMASDGLFRNIRELMESESDVLYTPTPALRCFNHRRPTVLAMHDIQHVHHPEFFSWPARLSRRVTYGLSAKHASYLQASSQYTKQDLLRNFPALSAEQVEVIPSGVQVEKFAAPATEDESSALAGLPERFLFFPAQLWPHKNHLTLLKALKQIEARHGAKIPLVLTGEKFSAAPGIFQFIAGQSMDYVRHLGKVTFKEMVTLYQKAAFMISATLHESSSLPILEAAAAGAPIIASRIPPIEELGQVLQLNLFEPLDVEGLARLIMALWDDGETASAQAAYNRQHIGFYSWANTARNYIRFFERIAN